MKPSYAELPSREIIILCARWYLRFKLSFLNLVETMAERDLSLVYTTLPEIEPV